MFKFCELSCSYSESFVTCAVLGSENSTGGSPSASSSICRSNPQDERQRMT